MSDKKTQWERCVEEARNDMDFIYLKDHLYKHAADLYAMRFAKYACDEGWVSADIRTYYHPHKDEVIGEKQLLEQFNNQEE